MKVARSPETAKRRGCGAMATPAFLPDADGEVLEPDPLCVGGTRSAQHKTTGTHGNSCTYVEVPDPPLPVPWPPDPELVPVDVGSATTATPLAWHVDEYALKAAESEVPAHTTVRLPSTADWRVRLMVVMAAGVGCFLRREGK